MSDGLEKRRDKRIALKFQVEIEVLHNHKVLSLISRDISTGGLGISKLAPEGMEIFTKEELFPDAMVRVNLILPGCDEEINLKGVVAWSERSKTGIWRAGIGFENPQMAIDRYNIIKESGATDKRTSVRYCHLFQIELRRLKEKQSHIGLSANLSSYGMQVFSDISLPNGTAIEVKMPIFGTDKKLIAKGLINWVRYEGEDTWRMGVRFNEPLAIDKFKF